jgi:Domain of unknown function (DUF5606)
MNLSKLVAVGGFPGIYRMVTNKSNGLIVEDLKEGKRQFVSSRTSNFTPLESIFIFIDNAEEESIALKEVFRKMLENIETIPVPAVKAADKEFKEYLAAVLPNYDRERVYVSDMKKLIKWFTFLNDADALSLEDDEPTTAAEIIEAEADPVVEEVAPIAEEKPKKKAAAKKKAE